MYYVKLKIHQMDLTAEWIDTGDLTTEQQKLLNMNNKKMERKAGTCGTISKSLTFVLL